MSGVELNTAWVFSELLMAIMFKCTKVFIYGENNLCLYMCLTYLCYYTINKDKKKATIIPGECDEKEET